MFGTDGRVVESGRNGMSLLDEAVVILQQIHIGAVQHAFLSTGNGSCMFAGRNACTCCLHADQLDVLVLDKWLEHADCVAPSSDTGNDGIWKAPFLLLNLHTGFIADYPLEVADDGREGVRA